jgi:hypothetical protein
MPKQFLWPRVLVEGVVVVSSILLAFGIQAAWDRRGESDLREAVLLGLTADFTAAELLLDDNMRNHQEGGDAVAGTRTLGASGGKLNRCGRYFAD